MRAHVDVLAWLFVLVGAMGVLTGVALAILATGAALAVSTGPSWFDGWSHPLVILLFLPAAVFAGGGAFMVLTGRGMLERRRSARSAALAVAAANLCLLPFGTALGVYAFWVLINDDARLEFSGQASAGR
jgi:hypothetical protein